MDFANNEQRQRAATAVFELMDSDGWKLMTKWLQAQREANISAMCAPGCTSDALHQLAGQTRLLDAVLKWPQQTFDVLQKRVAEQAKK